MRSRKVCPRGVVPVTEAQSAHRSLSLCFIYVSIASYQQEQLLRVPVCVRARAYVCLVQTVHLQHTCAIG